ncbi:hypothetical protein [Shumkonia mesophila]|uniref:hypothetical protein n=1 Tax=Shumkonia mesophila TaxID=2838854 RepID=UPI00293464BC|nr:hypothetical protein [Shumkonia mesophila]
MDSIEAGQRVKIPVHLLTAPFPDQIVAMIRFDGKNVSGILDRDEVIDVSGQSGFVRAEIIAIKADTVTLAVPKGLSAGTFSRNGRAVLPLAWARENLVLDSAP